MEDHFGLQLYAVQEDGKPGIGLRNDSAEDFVLGAGQSITLQADDDLLQKIKPPAGGIGINLNMQED
ncbi:hypothetical protein [Actinokineospora sp. NPDC004072]